MYRIGTIFCRSLFIYLHSCCYYYYRYKMSSEAKSISWLEAIKDASDRSRSSLVVVTPSLVAMSRWYSRIYCIVLCRFLCGVYQLFDIFKVLSSNLNIAQPRVRRLLHPMSNFVCSFVRSFALDFYHPRTVCMMKYLLVAASDRASKVVFFHRTSKYLLLLLLLVGLLHRIFREFANTARSIKINY